MTNNKQHEILKGTFKIDPNNLQFSGPVIVQEMPKIYFVSPENHLNFISTFQVVGHDGDRDFNIKFGEWNILQNSCYVKLVLILPFYEILRFKEILNDLKDPSNSSKGSEKKIQVKNQQQQVIEIPLTITPLTLYFTPNQYFPISVSLNMVQIYFGRKMGTLTMDKINKDKKIQKITKDSIFSPYSVTLPASAVNGLIDAIDTNIKTFEDKFDLKIKEITKEIKEKVSQIEVGK